jgi:hypothetical protein
MTRRGQFKPARVAVIIGALVWAAQTTSPKQVRTQPTALWIEALLHIEPGKIDPLPALAKAIEHPGSSDLDDLVASLLNAEPLALRNAVLAHTTLNPKTLTQLDGDPTWKYGKAVERQDLALLLWHTAKAGSLSAAKARDYARAAILLTAMDDFPLGASRLQTFTSDSSGLRLADITEQQAAQIQAHIQEVMEVEVDYNAKAGLAIDRLFLHPDASTVDSAVKIMDTWSKAAKDELSNYHFALDAQQLLNHTTKMGDSAAINEVRSHLDAWREGAEGPLKKWLDEAAERRARPSRVYFLMKWKDGKWVDTDTDGNIP